MREAINTMTDIIYTELFGLSRKALIAKAKQVAGKDWGFINWDNEDEKARDWMSMEAIQALTSVESEISERINAFDHIAFETMIAVIRHTAKEHGKVTNIWDTRA